MPEVAEVLAVRKSKVSLKLDALTLEIVIVIPSLSMELIFELPSAFVANAQLPEEGQTSVKFGPALVVEYPKLSFCLLVLI